MHYFFNQTTPLLTPRSKRWVARRGVESVVKAISTALKNQDSLDSVSAYNQFVSRLVTEIKKAGGVNSTATTVFAAELPPITKGKPLTERVVWGGVSLKKVNVAKDFIQKLLVIKKWGVLGFEIHERKLEKLRVVEGVCLVIFSNHTKKGWRRGSLTIKLAVSGDRFRFEPRDEHGIIALTDCVIEETSTNHLDDLVYIFKARQIA